jgi:hypothetical protein
MTIELLIIFSFLLVEKTSVAKFSEKTPLKHERHEKNNLTVQFPTINRVNIKKKY